jgi:biopolymer transport protein ExbD
MKLPRRHPPEPHIPFIALADIAWQIIIFFLVAATFAKNDSLTVDLPGSTNQPQAQQQESITVQAGENVLMINGENVSVQQLQERLARMLTGKKTQEERAVVVMGRDDLSFQRDVEIMYAVQKAGGILVMSEEK